MRKIALALAALVMALGAGCSDDKSDDSPDGGGNGGDGGEAAGSAFCEGLQSFADIGNAEALSGEEGTAAIEELTALEPPAEIADDFATFVGYLESVAAGEVPDQATTDAWNEATARVDAFAAEECGLTAG